MKRMKILIDNGHGIETPGKCSPDGRLREYQYCRRVAAKVVEGLKKRGYDASLLTPEISDISLSERCRRANAECAKMGNENVCLVSIHNNAAPPNDNQWHAARGWEAWTSPGQTCGDKLADALYAAAARLLPKDFKIRKDLSDGDADKESNFTILKKTRCAACLTENLFQDNRRDTEWLLSDEGFNTIVRIHVEGIIEFMGL